MMRAFCVLALVTVLLSQVARASSPGPTVTVNQICLPCIIPPLAAAVANAIRAGARRMKEIHQDLTDTHGTYRSTGAAAIPKPAPTSEAKTPAPAKD